MKIPCVKKPCKDCPYRKYSLKGRDLVFDTEQQCIDHHAE